ncbi:DNA polymerase III subunit delta [Hydrogenovibrio sp. JE_KL2]|uniref:DNA polymerase III subunit delta n=1 Tax=Hydrogenovibrio sp. JE_KL2 TaxID=2651188 RepID=UPI00135300DF|nr:DNA polymerase III subunit delta [Hydrogenovibrio sp. JE_KL2]
MITAPAFIRQAQQPGFQIKPLVLIYGEEPLYVRLSLDALREALKAQGFMQRDRYDVEGQFNWQDLQMDTQAMSLFADKRIIELDMPKGTPGKEGGEFIRNWLNQQQQVMDLETVVVITCEKLDSRQTKAKWYQAIEAQGLVVQSKPIEGNALIQWCQKRAADIGLQLDGEAAAELAQRVEGNLLAADQELEKLGLLFPQGAQLTVDNIRQSVADQAHYQLFALSTAMLLGKTQYALQILHRLQQEGLEAPIVLWLLSKELRSLIAVSQKQQTMNLAQAYKQLNIWSSKQNEFNAALRRHNLSYWQSLLGLAMQIDFQIKGLSQGDEWVNLSNLVFKISQ